MRFDQPTTAEGSAAPEGSMLDRSAPASISLAELARLLRLRLLPREPRDALERFTLLPLAPGEALYRSGDRLRSVYAVRSGFLKTCVIRGSAEQVLAFPMPGDVLGLDGLGDGLHATDAVALEDCAVAVIPRADLDRLVVRFPPLAEHLWHLVGREFALRTELVSLLGTGGAETRVAAFLLSLAERFASRGYSPHWFRLRMTRSDIAHLLGLSHETVTRILGRLAAAGWIRVDLKTVEIVDPAALRALASDDAFGTRSPHGARPRARLNGRRDAGRVAAGAR